MDNDFTDSLRRPFPEPNSGAGAAASPDSQAGSLLPHWPPAPAAPAPVAPRPAMPDVPAAGPQNTMPLPWAAPESRDEVPWDRPGDFDQPTDTAWADDHPSWDTPASDSRVDATPTWPPVVSAVGAPRETISADPDDAYAPVLGDVSPTMARAWPEANGHDAQRSAATIVQPGYSETITPVDSGTAVESAAALENLAAPDSSFIAQPSFDVAPAAWALPSPPAARSALAPQTSGHGLEPLMPDEAPAPFVTEQPPASQFVAPPVPEPAERPLSGNRTEEVENGTDSTPRPELFAAAVATRMNASDATAPLAVASPAPPTPSPIYADYEAWLNDTPWPSEPPAAEMPPFASVPEAEPPWLTEAHFTQDAADQPPKHVAENALHAEPAGAPVVVRIELAIVDGQLRVVYPADSAETGSPLQELPEPRRTASDDDWSEPPESVAKAPLTSADEPTSSEDTAPAAIAAAPPAARAESAVTSTAEPTSASTPESQAAHGAAVQNAAPVVLPWAEDPSLPDPLAEFPAATMLREPDADALDSTAGGDRPEAVAAATAQLVPAAAQDHNDLWSLATAPEDVDVVPHVAPDAAPKASSTVLTAVVTIGMAILVVALVLVFFSLMTSLLG